MVVFAIALTRFCQAFAEVETPEGVFYDPGLSVCAITATNGYNLVIVVFMPSATSQQTKCEKMYKSTLGYGFFYDKGTEKTVLVTRYPNRQWSRIEVCDEDGRNISSKIL